MTVVTQLKEGSPWSGFQHMDLSEKEMKEVKPTNSGFRIRQNNVKVLTPQTSFMFARVLFPDEFFDAFHILVHVISRLTVTVAMECTLGERIKVHTEDLCVTEF